MATTKSNKKRGLGRGLEALLGEANPMPESVAGTQTLLLSQLRPGRYQPRQLFTDEAISELAESIKAQGLIQPIAVRPLPGVRLLKSLRASGAFVLRRKPA